MAVNVKLSNQYEKARLVQEKQKEKLRLKLADPAYRQSQYDKHEKAKLRAQAKQINKMKTSEYRNEQIQKKQISFDKKYKKQPLKLDTSPIIKPVNPPPVKTKKKKRSKGLMGRSPTAQEKRIMNLIGGLNCICCINKGLISGIEIASSGLQYISLHHTNGRVSKFAHSKVLPLCQWHHDQVSANELPDNVFPIHGNKKRWEKENGTEKELLKQVYEMINEPLPWLIIEGLN